PPPAGGRSAVPGREVPRVRVLRRSNHVRIRDRIAASRGRRTTTTTSPPTDRKLPPMNIACLINDDSLFSQTRQNLAPYGFDCARASNETVLLRSLQRGQADVVYV